MECKIKNDIGTIYITEDVMLKVVGYAALECYGIVAMSSKRAKGWPGGMAGPRKSVQGCSAQAGG